MPIDLAEVRRIARLAYLEVPRVVETSGARVEPKDLLLSDAELEQLALELSGILEYVADLDALDLTGVEPTSHGVPLLPQYREDVVGEHLPTERALELAPERAGDGFAVPKIIE